jgi:hypothetical protein
MRKREPPMLPILLIPSRCRHASKHHVAHELWLISPEVAQAEIARERGGI